MDGGPTAGSATRLAPAAVIRRRLVTGELRVATAAAAWEDGCEQLKEAGSTLLDASDKG